jgi:hypothetical protein
MGKGAFQGEESVLADSGREGEVIAGVGRVRRATFSASCSPRHLSLISNLGKLGLFQQWDGQSQGG